VLGGPGAPLPEHRPHDEHEDDGNRRQSQIIADTANFGRNGGTSRARPSPLYPCAGSSRTRRALTRPVPGATLNALLRCTSI